MLKITFMGAGSTVFVKNVIGDCMCTPSLQSAEIALYDIDEQRLAESKIMLEAINSTVNEGRATVKTYLGVAERKNALKDANFVVNAIQIGGYEPSTVIDFEVPKKFGLQQTIADTLGVGGIMRALRTLPVLMDFVRDMEAVCPNAYLLNYTNPMSMLTGYVQKNSTIKAVGLCHSVQVCARDLLNSLDMKDVKIGKEVIAGINHMGWLLEIEDENGKDLYPEIKKAAKAKNENEKHKDMVRFEYINRFGHYCTESSEHNAEYNNFFIKSKYPELIDRYNIPLDEYPRRCREQIANWAKQKEELMNNNSISHTRSHEYASYIMEAIVTNTPFKIGGNVINNGHLIENLPADCCVEVPCMVDGSGINPCYVGKIPPQLAAMNMTHVNVHTLVWEAFKTGKKEYLYNAVMLEPHASSELSIDDIYAMVDELLEEHKKSGFPVLD